MIIKDFKTFVVANPSEANGSVGNGGRYFLFVKLVTDTGITGYGEAYSIPFHPKVARQMIDDVCERMVVGQNPFNIEKIWRQIYSRGFTMRPDTSILGVLSGIEIALWDIVGKAAGQPVYNLLGGKIREKLRSYTYIYPAADDAQLTAYTDPDVAAERALHYKNMGFTALKFDPVGPYTSFDPYQIPIKRKDDAAKFARRIREAVGGDVDLLFGTHGQPSPSSALRLARELEAVDPLWFEEPTGAEMPEAMAKIARATNVPIATGERLSTKYEFARVLATGAASIIQPNLGRAGGILEGKKIAAIAETHYAEVAPHLYCGPIVGAASVQLDTCIPNFLIQESIETWGGFHGKLLKKKMEWQDGFIIPPTEPGIGVELDEAVAEAHPYEGEALHLDMASREPTQDY